MQIMTNAAKDKNIQMTVKYDVEPMELIELRWKNNMTESTARIGYIL